MYCKILLCIYLYYLYVVATRGRDKSGPYVNCSKCYVGTLDPRGNYEMKTGSGSVHVTLAPDASFRLQASTGSGRVVNEFDGFAAAYSSQAPLKIKTGSGGIHVYRG